MEIGREGHLQQSEIGLPLVANDLATGETPDGDYHLSQTLKAIKHCDPVLYRDNVYQGIGYMVSPSLSMYSDYVNSLFIRGAATGPSTNIQKVPSKADDSPRSGACTAEYIGFACGKSSALPSLPQSKSHPLQPVSMVTGPGMINFENTFMATHEIGYFTGNVQINFCVL